VSRHRFGIAAVLFAGLAAVVSAQDTKFELKLNKNDKGEYAPFYQKMSTNVTQVIVVQGQNLTQKQESTFFFQWTPVKQEGDKIQIKQKVEGLRMSIDISGNPIVYDSTNKDAAGASGNPGLTDFFKNLENAEFTSTIDAKTYKVEKVDGKDAFVAKLGAGNAAMDNLLKKIMTDDALKQMCDPTYGLIPATPKKPNDTWEEKKTLNLGPIGSYEVAYKFKYVGKEKDFDKLEVTTNLIYKAPTDNPDGLLFKIKSGDLKSEATEPGVVLYNPKEGRVESATIKIKIRGELMVSIGGTDTKVELTQEQTTAIGTDSKSFIPAKK
jgi:hypothetical protein